MRESRNHARAGRVQVDVEDFYNAVPLIVKQPKNFFVDQSEYYCYNRAGHQIAYVHEVGLGTGMQVLRAFAGNTAGFQRSVVVNDAWRRPRLYLAKDWSIGTASTSVSVPNGPTVGVIDQVFRLTKPEFRLLDPHRRQVGSIEGNFRGREFQIYDHNHHEVCRISRQTADLGELFTSADTYVVWQRYLELPEPLRTLVVAAGIAIDLVLFEGKR